MTQAPWPQQAPQGYAGPQQGYPPQQQPYPPMPGPQGAPQQPYPPAPGPQGPQPVQQPWQQTPQAAPPQQQYDQSSEGGDDEFFTSGMGGTYMSFSDDACIGHPRGGEIVGVSERQQTNAKTRELEFWPDGNKKMVKIVTLQTQERAPNTPDDMGLRTIWLPQSRDITKAVIEALKAAQDEMRLKLGGQLWVTRTGSRQTTQANGSRGLPAFTYTAQYIPPKGSDNFFAGNGAAPQGQPPVQNAPQQGAPPWQQGAQPSQGNAYATGPQGPPPPQQPYPPQGPPQNGGYPTQQQQPGWAQQPPQGGYQPSAPDPANPFPGQPQQPQYPPQQGGYPPPPQQQQYPQQG